DPVAPDCVHEPRVRNGFARSPIGIELDDSRRLRPQLVDRTRPRIALEEADRDERRDDAREHDAEQEDGRELETKQPEHGASVLLAQEDFAGSRAGLTL